eukprot:6187637-Pleurochrysis_carterae.AAC.1
MKHDVLKAWNTLCDGVKLWRLRRPTEQHCATDVSAPGTIGLYAESTKVAARLPNEEAEDA